MVQNEAGLWKYWKKNTPQIRWTKIENTSSLGTPDLLGVNNNNTWFTVELKVTKGNKLRFSPHQIAFHVKHPHNTFILVKDARSMMPKLYEGERIRELAACGLELEACCLGLEACCLLFEGLGA